MTIRFTKSWNGYYEGQIVSDPAGGNTEAQLIALGYAVSDLDGPDNSFELAKFATDTSGNVTGLVGPGNMDPLEFSKRDVARAVDNGRRILPPTYGSTRDSGTRIVDISTASLTITAATQRIASPIVGSSSALRLLPTANVDITGLSFVTPSTQFSIGFWAYKPMNQPRSSICLFVSTSAGYTNYMTSYVVIEPGLHYYAIPRANFAQFGTGFPLGGTIVQMRFRDLNSAGDYPTLATGSNILIGDLYIASKPKALWVWGFDDCKTNLYTPTGGGTEIVGGDGVSKLHSFASFLTTYGWKGTAYTIGGLLGASGFCTVSQLRTLQDTFGWTIGTHSYSHPDSTDVSPGTIYGLRTLGPAGYALLTNPWQFTAAYTGVSLTARNDSQAIRDDIEQAMALLEGNGLRGYLHFATPQSATDFYVQEALRACGTRTVRGPKHSVFADNRFALSNGAISGGSGANNSLITATEVMASGVSLDSGGNTDADVESYIDAVIAIGAVGATQIHDWNLSTTRNPVKHCADYLKAKEQQGLITIVTAEELFAHQLKNFRTV